MTNVPVIKCPHCNKRIFGTVHLSIEDSDMPKFLEWLATQLKDILKVDIELSNAPLDK